MFLTCVACAEDSSGLRLCVWARTSRPSLPSLVKTCFRLPMDGSFDHGGSRPRRVKDSRWRQCRHARRGSCRVRRGLAGDDVDDAAGQVAGVEDLVEVPHQRRGMLLAGYGDDGVAHGDRGHHERDQAEQGSTHPGRGCRWCRRIRSWQCVTLRHRRVVHHCPRTCRPSRHRQTFARRS
jgi:hypothetical protein